MLNVQNIVYFYDKKNTVLNNVSFNLNKGELLTIAGPNGSGKTTLIKLIVDLLKIQEGSIFINKSFHDNPSVKKEIIYLSSEDFLPDFLTGKEYIEMICDFYDTPLDKEKLFRLVDYYSLDSKLDQLIENYSHGMRKKIQLVSAFMINNKIIIIDETLNGIDVEAKEATKLLFEQYKRRGGSIIMCTHDLELVEEIGYRVLLINNGVIYIDDLIENILKTGSNLTNVFKELIDYEGMKNEIEKYF
ncbi:ABC transporter ATP-binding protein [Siminovitchia sp. FSL H7-0308]|uniref:ABC-2 type transport system ATP-binding protein n=1 Tax=Siminovitchia thermophila TaxID=1245522 RepID=A0ABS2RCI5_9BACI|nr:ABC transporter ATP-binding protein [Siminovitchia thermophila]MBM7717362.1 ABC-2 type transport system ATP-binding protein [Siminovitchia thermophila]ONK22311.1 hypothetical protein BLX87_16775 [Bacillus sp. VT-16-64]